jgi:transposase InsO family protein/transposase-like protein
MSKKFSNIEKEQIVAKYISGQPVAELCIEHSIPRSTMYYWIGQYHPLKSTADTTVCYRKYVELKRHTDKLEAQLSVIKAAGCGTSAPLKEKLAALEKLYGQYSVYTLCDALEVSRGTFYNHIFRRKEVTVYDKRREEIRVQVKAVFDENKQRLGSNKICAILADRGIRTSGTYVAELMREMSLESIGRNFKREHKKYTGRHNKENLLQQKFNVSEPNRVWVSDVTCYKVDERYFYVCVVIDLFSRKIIAHGVSQRNSTYLVTSTFRRAFEARNHPQRLLFHSDSGVQYTSITFRNQLLMNNIVQSFSKSGSPHDNAVAESFFSAMKKEELYRTNYRSEREFRASVDDYIMFFNTKRPHRTLAYKTPERFEILYGCKENVDN